ncbi:MAG: diphosphomevalonate decarboxylase [Deltaproteobacteria bacterium]|nr:diphosphomevalonate decarboxylase [Deltaproteobacteria bacterium]
MNVRDAQRPAAVTARACSNVALVKYWGKVDQAHRVPATGSLSVTLGGLTTETTVAFSQKKGDDLVVLDGRSSEGREGARVAAFLDRIRSLALEQGVELGAASVRTANFFPTAAGLASSASGFAALAGAALEAAGLEASHEELANLARLGSASAARSIHGGFVELVPFEGGGGAWDARVAQVAGPKHWDLRVLVTVVDAGYKPLGSTPAMARTEATSPYYDGWLATWGADLKECRQAIESRDLERLASVCEHSALKLHALTMTSRPPVLFLRGPSLELMHEVWALRHSGTLCAFTADAGPNVKVICEPDDEATVQAALLSVRGVQSVRSSPVGGPIEIVHHEVDPSAVWERPEG